MSKLSFKRLLREFNQELEDFSSQMEEDETPQQKQQRIQTNMQTPQQVQKTQGFADDSMGPEPHQTFRDLADEWNVDPGQLRSIFQKAKDGGGFTHQDYQQLQSMVGDIDSFMMDIQKFQPMIYAELQQAGYDQAVETNANMANPAPGKPIKKLNQKMGDLSAVDSNPIPKQAAKQQRKLQMTPMIPGQTPPQQQQQIQPNSNANITKPLENPKMRNK